MSITSLGSIFRTLFGNAATAFAIVMRKFPPLMAFSEGYAIGLCTMFLIVLAFACYVSFLIYMILGLIFGALSLLLPVFGNRLAMMPGKVGLFFKSLYRALVLRPEQIGKVSVAKLIGICKGISFVFTFFPAFTFLPYFVLAMIGFGALCTALACIYSVKPPTQMNRVVWIVSGLLGYFSAYGTVGLAALRDTINTVFKMAVSTIMNVLIYEIINLAIMIVFIVISSFAQAMLAFVYDFVSGLIIADPRRFTTGLMMVLLLGGFSFVIVVYFSALSIISAIFTNIITSIFQALGKRYERTSCPGFAYFASMLVSVAYAGIMVPLVLFGIGLVLVMFFFVYSFIKAAFAAQIVEDILESPLEVLKFITGNTLVQTIWASVFSYFFWDVVRMFREGVIKAVASFNASPRIVLGMTAFYVTLIVMTILGIPGYMIISEIYIIGLPMLVMSSLMHACIAGLPTRQRGATTASNILLYSITFMLIYGALGALALYSIVPPNAALSLACVGEALQKYAMNTTILSKGFYTSLVNDAVSSTMGFVNNISPTYRYMFGKFMIMPTMSVNMLVFGQKPPTYSRDFLNYLLNTRCSFTYGIFKALGENFEKYMMFEYDVYEKVSKGVTYCKLPTGVVMKCSDVAKKLSEEYFCTYIFYKLTH